MTWSIASYSPTPASNTLINGTNIGVNCPPSDVGVFMRQIMADLATFTQGTDGSTYPILSGSYGSRNLTGTNNATTPTTKFDVSADLVALRNPTTGATSVVTGSAATNDITVAGPAANGRDQAGVFSANSFVHLYWIYNPTTATIATISSANLPATGPTLPSGYTAWCYIGAFRLNGSAQYAPVYYLRGGWIKHQVAVTSLSGGGAQTPTAVSVAAIVPPNALEYEINVFQLAITSTAGGLAALSGFIESAPTLASYQFGFTMAGTASTLIAIGGPSFRIPNIAQSYSYVSIVGNGAGPSQSHAITGYSVPNGAQ